MLHEIKRHYRRQTMCAHLSSWLSVQACTTASDGCQRVVGRGRRRLFSWRVRCAVTGASLEDGRRPILGLLLWGVLHRWRRTSPITVEGGLHDLFTSFYALPPPALPVIVSCVYYRIRSNRRCLHPSSRGVVPMEIFRNIVKVGATHSKSPTIFIVTPPPRYRTLPDTSSPFPPTPEKINHKKKEANRTSTAN